MDKNDIGQEAIIYVVNRNKTIKRVLIPETATLHKSFDYDGKSITDEVNISATASNANIVNDSFNMLRLGNFILVNGRYYIITDDAPFVENHNNSNTITAELEELWKFNTVRYDSSKFNPKKLYTIGEIVGSVSQKAIGSDYINYEDGDKGWINENVRWPSDNSSNKTGNDEDTCLSVIFKLFDLNSHLKNMYFNQDSNLVITSIEFSKYKMPDSSAGNPIFIDAPLDPADVRNVNARYINSLDHILRIDTNISGQTFARSIKDIKTAIRGYYEKVDGQSKTTKPVYAYSNDIGQYGKIWAPDFNSTSVSSESSKESSDSDAKDFSTDPNYYRNDPDLLKKVLQIQINKLSMPTLTVDESLIQNVAVPSFFPTLNDFCYVVDDSMSTKITANISDVVYDLTGRSMPEISLNSFVDSKTDSDYFIKVEKYISYQRKGNNYYNY